MYVCIYYTDLYAYIDMYVYVRVYTRVEDLLYGLLGHVHLALADLLHL